MQFSPGKLRGLSISSLIALFRVATRPSPIAPPAVMIAPHKARMIHSLSRWWMR